MVTLMRRTRKTMMVRMRAMYQIASTLSYLTALWCAVVFVSDYQYD